MDGTLVHPPSVLKLLAHEVRWNLMRYLARSDYRVGELVHLLALPQNLVSYHLRQLHKEHLVTERRSNSDERSVYYSLDLTRLHTLYTSAAGALHPALGKHINLSEREQWYLPNPPLCVLFLCTGNSARSQMAEALLRCLSHGRVQAYSAGSQPAAHIHPLAVRVMEAKGIDMSQQYPKHFELFCGQHLDAIITVCDRVREVCTTFPNDPQCIHWSFADPATAEGSQDMQCCAFEQTSLQLTTRIRLLLTLLEQEYGTPTDESKERA